MNILLVHTGGTIGSSQNYEENMREQNAETVKTSKRALIAEFENSNLDFVGEVNIIDSAFPDHLTTLSESMTPEKLSEIIRFIRDKLKENDYAGIIVLHGTDSLAYTAALFSFIFADIKMPLFLVSCNRPPNDPLSNAKENFIWAIKLIYAKIAPNVYVTYRSSDGKIRLFLASNIMQSANYSEDFLSASPKKVFEAKDEGLDTILSLCDKYSRDRVKHPLIDIALFSELSQEVLLIRPYTGLDYSMFEACLNKECWRAPKAIVHGTYHSGTVSLPGLVLDAKAESYRKNDDISNAEKFQKMALSEMYSEKSILYLSGLCAKNDIGLYIAPSTLGCDQYETMSVVSKRAKAVLLNMTCEAAYAKLVTAFSFNLSKEQALDYMCTNINGEFN